MRFSVLSIEGLGVIPLAFAPVVIRDLSAYKKLFVAKPIPKRGKQCISIAAHDEVLIANFTVVVVMLNGV
jgi:hypothetical protein